MALFQIINDELRRVLWRPWYITWSYHHRQRLSSVVPPSLITNLILFGARGLWVDSIAHGGGSIGFRHLNDNRVACLVVAFLGTAIGQRSRITLATILD